MKWCESYKTWNFVLELQWVECHSNILITILLKWHLPKSLLSSTFAFWFRRLVRSGDRCTLYCALTSSTRSTSHVSHPDHCRESYLRLGTLFRGFDACWKAFDGCWKLAQLHAVLQLLQCYRETVKLHALSMKSTLVIHPNTSRLISAVARHALMVCSILFYFWSTVTVEYMNKTYMTKFHTNVVNHLITSYQQPKASVTPVWISVLEMCRVRCVDSGYLNKMKCVCDSGYLLDGYGTTCGDENEWEINSLRQTNVSTIIGGYIMNNNRFGRSVETTLLEDSG